MAFQKRHLIAHKLGIVDRDYITKTGDTNAVVGRKIVIDVGEVNRLIGNITTLALHMAARLQSNEDS